MSTVLLLDRMAVLPRFLKLRLSDSDELISLLWWRRFGKGSVCGDDSSTCVVSAADVGLCESEVRAFGLACGRVLRDTRDRRLSDGVKYRLRASTKPRGAGRRTGARLSASGDDVGEQWPLTDVRRGRGGEATSDDDPTTASD